MLTQWAARVNPSIRAVARARRLLADDISLERAYGEIQAERVRGRAAASTVDALVYQLRKGGAALSDPNATATAGGVERAADARSIGAAAEIHAACCASLDARRGRGFRRVVERAPWMMRQRFPSKRSSASAMKPKPARIRASPSRNRSRKGLRAAKARYCSKTCGIFCALCHLSVRACGDRACSLDRSCASHGRMGKHAKACLSVARAGVGKDAINGSIGASGSRSGRGRECHAGLSFPEGWRRRRAADDFV